MVDVYIGLGSNVGDRRSHLRHALDRLSQAECQVRGVSSLYESAPVDCPGGDFLNAVALLGTALTPRALLELMLEIESERGRIRGARCEARTLDLDLLLYGRKVIDEEGLTIPHPRIDERAFVLVPLLELSPDLRRPIRANPIGERFNRDAGGNKLRRMEQDWWRYRAEPS